jgi:mannose-1-phosphate guanylyltransferase/phosphomannomutase
MIRAMVLAAGVGSRLRPLTYELPKPLVPVLNRPVLHHVFDNLLRHGIKDVMVNLHTHPEQVRGYCGNGSRWNLHVHYSIEPKLLGTAGAVKRVESFFSGGSFFVMSGDGISDIDLTEMLAFHRKRQALATMALKAVESRFDYGVTLTEKSGKIKSFLEKPLWGDVFSNKANTGIYLFEPEVLRYIPKNHFYDFGSQLWPRLLALKKPIYAYETRNYWCDIGSLAEYRKCQIDSLDGRVRINLPGRELQRGIWAEEETSISPGAVLHGPCLIGKGCKIETKAKIGPYTILGNSARISSQAVLKNCILFDNVTVGRNVHLSNCILGANGTVTGNITVYEAAVLNVQR